MPAWAALTASSAAFAGAHAGAAPVQDMPQLWAMGMVLGMAFLRSRSLLAPIAAHTINNSVALMKDCMGDA